MKVVFLVGATGTGKSRHALELAHQVPGSVIINADSVQLYQRLDIGSAKPTLEERKQVPHYLYDVIPPPETVTAGVYNRLFFETVKALETKTPLALVVGGTGFYFQAIEKGLLPIPPANPEIQAELLAELKESDGEKKLHAELAAKDPRAAQRIHPRDHYRLIRALDILRSTGRPITEILEKHEKDSPGFPYPLLKVGLKMPREVLVERLQRRTEEMLRSGWLEEVRGLMEEGYGHWEPLRSVGYKQCVEYLSRKGGESPESLKELADQIVSETLKLAKKQRTWFQRDRHIQWFEPSDDSGMIGPQGQSLDAFVLDWLSR